MIEKFSCENLGVKLLTPTIFEACFKDVGLWSLQLYYIT